MTDFRPPLRDIDFVLNHVVDLANLASYDAFAHADPDTVRGVLEEAGRFAAEVLAPLNRVGDRQGSRLEPDGTVHTPEGWSKAYRQYVDAGWGGVAGDPDYGGAGALGLERQFLHAARLAFEHPFTGEPVDVSSPLPEDLAAALPEV